MVSLSFISLGLSLLAAFGAAAPLDITKRDSPIKVTLAATKENGVVEASVTNTGATDLTILKLGSIFADEPIEKLKVSSGESDLEFKGVRLRYLKDNLAADAFTTLAAGQTVKTTVELVGLYDLSSASNLRVQATGSFQYTEAGAHVASVQDTGTIEFESNSLDFAIDTEAASKAGMLGHALRKRVLRESCSGSRSTALSTALSLTATRARAASTAATSGSTTLFNTFFKTTASSTRSTVAARLAAVASAASSTGGSVEYYCTDAFGLCSTNVLAWTLPSDNIIANCNIYYTAIPGSTNTCHAQDQWTTSLHELTHAPGVFSPGTADNGYGYAAATALSAARALLNADTYALYAQSVFLGCS